ncbi:MAG: class I SAM-dependent methyltransferase [Streptosporangiaceae bacterium]
MPDDDRSAAQHRRQASSFGAAAAAYERGRPPYPPEAVDWLLPGGASRVLDLGAGTGKLTRQLSDRGLDVIAMEPSAGMREQLARAVPGVPVHAGSAEEIPLADGSVEAVLVAQAWHWVDRGRAVREVARVLVPGGRLGLVWNIRDEREEWVAELGRILHDPGEHREEDRGIIGPPFGAVERRDVEWKHRLSLDELIDLAASRSYVITMPEDQRAAVLAGVRRLAGRAGSDELLLPYVTECYRARLDS